MSDSLTFELHNLNDLELYLIETPYVILILALEILF